MNDLLYFSEALITEYQPRAVAIYEGDNDIAQGIYPFHLKMQFQSEARKSDQGAIR
ncbi:MAG: hypothetical protein ACI9LM_004982 [Alteromonadaceae bacterium]|jgi:hypothetical protein